MKYTKVTLEEYLRFEEIHRVLRKTYPRNGFSGAFYREINGQEYPVFVDRFYSEEEIKATISKRDSGKSNLLTS